MSSLPPYAHPGARALVELHEAHLRAFFRTWLDARAANLALPETDDESYASLQTLLHHLLDSAAFYLTWSCKALGLPDPAIEEAPDPTLVEREAERYIEHLLERWRTPLAGVPPEAFATDHATPWRSSLCVEGMLEHAVMHPIRHTAQLRKLLDAATG